MADNNIQLVSLYPSYNTTSRIVPASIQCDVLAIANCLKNDWMTYYYTFIILLSNTLYSDVPRLKVKNSKVADMPTSYANEET